MTQAQSSTEVEEIVADEEAVEVRSAIKVLKIRFDEPGWVDTLVPVLYRGALLSTHQAFKANDAEILHQLALVLERRGDVSAALRLYEQSRRAFVERDNSSSLGLAREIRDCGFMHCRHGDTDTGLRLVEEAIELHADDSRNTKGWRQLRITKAYQLRAQIVAGVNVEDATAQIVEIALDYSADFCLRDQYFLVTFARSCVHGPVRLKLDRRLIEINRKRIRPLGTAKSIANLVIGTELSVIGRLLKAVAL